MVPGLSAYLSSKLALHKVLEFVAAENPTVFAAALHPGMIETDVFRKSGGDKEMLPMDSGNFFVFFLGSGLSGRTNG